MQCCKQCWHVQVLEALPAGVAVDVLRAAPGTFSRNFTHLPSPLKSIAALAEHRALAAACMPVAAHSPSCDAARTLPTVSLCIDSDSTDACMPGGAPVPCAEHPSEGKAAGSGWWLQRAARCPGGSGAALFCLERRYSVVACHMHATVGLLEGLTLDLPDNACIVLGPGTMHMRNMTFSGAQSPIYGSPLCTFLQGCSC